MRKKLKMDWLRSALWMRRRRSRFRSLNLPNSRRAGKRRSSVVCIGGRTPLDEAAAAMLAGLLNKHGLKARVVESETISAGNIVSLEAAKAKLVCLSFLGIGSSPAQIRYLVRRLRRILPSGCMILVGCWTDDAAGAPLKALKETAEADAYATSLHEAAEIAVDAARRGHELVTPLQPAAQGTSSLLEVLSGGDVPLKIVPQPPDDSPLPAKNRKSRTRREIRRVGS